MKSLQKIRGVVHSFQLIQYKKHHPNFLLIVGYSDIHNQVTSETFWLLETWIFLSESPNCLVTRENSLVLYFSFYQLDPYNQLCWGMWSIWMWSEDFDAPLWGQKLQGQCDVWFQINKMHTKWFLYCLFFFLRIMFGTSHMTPYKELWLFVILMCHRFITNLENENDLEILSQ